MYKIYSIYCWLYMLCSKIWYMLLIYFFYINVEFVQIHE